MALRRNFQHSSLWFGVNLSPPFRRAIDGKLIRFPREIVSEIEHFVPGRDISPVHLNDSGTDSEILKMFLFEIGHVFLRPLYQGTDTENPRRSLESYPVPALERHGYTLKGISDL